MKKLVLLLVVLVGCQAANSAPAPAPIPVVPEPARPAKPVVNYIEIHSDAEYNAKLAEINSVKGWRYIEDFSASWCGPCQQLAPIYKRVADQNKHVLFLKIDIDDCPQAAKLNRVTSIPCIILKGKKYVGVTSEKNLMSVVRETFPLKSRTKK